MKIQIGQTEDGAAVRLDAKNLIYSRALIQANSGGGKSGLLRVIAEQVAAHIPTIIIDKEGEYHTLREKVDLILVGHEKGELAADVRSAGLLARKLVELGASAVLDLSGFTKAGPQHEFVKNFLEALLHLPKTLWHPTLVIIDEAHYFAPERGMGESVALESVIDLMTLGRKRGFGGILATQRLAKLNKNAADANNIFIGRTNTDVDQDRAIKALGFKPADRVLVRDLEKRNFYAYGPDLETNGVFKFYTADCRTTIPKPGDKKHLIPPAASSVVKDLVKKLEDLPQEAEQEIQNFTEAKRQISTLTAEIRKLKAGQQPREQDAKQIIDLQVQLEKARTHVKEKTTVVQKRFVIGKDLARLEALVARAESLNDQWGINTFNLKEATDKIGELLAEVKSINEQELKSVMPQLPAGGRDIGVVMVQNTLHSGSAVSRMTQPKKSEVLTRPANTNGEGEAEVTAPMQRILNELAELSAVGISPADKAQVALFCGYKNVRSGGFTTPLGALSSKGLVAYPQTGFIELTDAGRRQAHAPEGILSRDELQNRIKSKLSGAHQKILEEVIAIYPHAIDKTELADKLGYKNVRSGGFTTPLGRLSTLGLIAYPKTGFVAATTLLFPPGL